MSNISVSHPSPTETKIVNVFDSAPQECSVAVVTEKFVNGMKTPDPFAAFPHFASNDSLPSTITVESGSDACSPIELEVDCPQPTVVEDEGPTADGHYRHRMGEIISARYEVDQLVGKGTFGVVLRAHDLLSKEVVVIKIVRNAKAYFDAAQSEIRLLRLMNAADPQDKSGIVRMRDCFVWRGHQCLVFELLGESLYDLLRRNHFQGFSLHAVSKYARQILTTLEFMSRSDINVMHCDLKPENILIHPKSIQRIKVIDFGSSCQESQQFYSYIQSRYYRAPEVILRMPKYTKAIDMWSLGCLLFELHTGQPLFEGNDICEQVARMVAVRGVPPAPMLFHGRVTSSYFVNNNFKSRWSLSPCIAVNKVSHDNIPELLAASPQGKMHYHSTSGGPRHQYVAFMDLLERMLTYDPSKRITASEALRHPFLTTPFRSKIMQLKLFKRPARSEDTACNSPGSESKPREVPDDSYSPPPMELKSSSQRPTIRSGPNKERKVSSTMGLRGQPKADTSQHQSDLGAPVSITASEATHTREPIPHKSYPGAIVGHSTDGVRRPWCGGSAIWREADSQRLPWIS